MRAEYTLGSARRNSYAKRLGGGREWAELERRYFESERYVQLDADVAGEFDGAASVNEAPRLVMRLRTVGGCSRAPQELSSKIADPVEWVRQHVLAS